MVNSLKLTFLVEDTVDKSRKNLKPAHGLAVNVNAEVEGKHYAFLMDTGPSPEQILHNAHELNVDLREIRAIFLSHGHYDHTGGLIGTLKTIGKKIPVIAHPKILELKLATKPTIRINGSSFTKADIEENGGSPLLTVSPVPLTNGVSTTGEIERTTPYEKTRGFRTIVEAIFKEDPIMDDQSLIFNLKNKGLAIVSGCAHAGIINTVKQAQKIMGTETVYAVIGGFHLHDADGETIQKTVDDLVQINPQIVAPCHCTGKRAVTMLKKAFKSRCIVQKTGDILEL